LFYEERVNKLRGGTIPPLLIYIMIYFASIAGMVTVEPRTVI
jgi:hypothetical protein